MAATFSPGDRVAVRLWNGYATAGVVVRVYKNGRVGVREADVEPGSPDFGRDAYRIRKPQDLKAAP